MTKTTPSHQPLEFEHLSLIEAQERVESFHTLMSKRRTVRDYSDKPVPKAIIQHCVATAGLAPSGANQQPWHFVCISDAETKRQIRHAAEQEERAFYGGRAGEEWLDALQHLGTNDQKPFLETAPWLITIFAQRWDVDEKGDKIKHYYVPESVGIATGVLITALHNAGLATLTHTPAPMNFLRDICGRPDNEKPVILLVVGYPAEGAQVPVIDKKPAHDVMHFIETPSDIDA